VVDPAEADKVLATVDALGLPPNALKAVWTTHHHRHAALPASSRPPCASGR